jgi:sugar lactone lactonase YvrE
MGVQSRTNPRRRQYPPHASLRVGGCFLPVFFYVFFLTYCGSPTRSIGQVASAATVPLLYPASIVYDRTGVLYLVETNRHVVDKIDLIGNLSVFAGDGAQGFSGDGGPATAAQLDSPQGIAVDSAGNLFIADTHNHRIRRVDGISGVITTVAGTGIAGYAGDLAVATSARLNTPVAVAVDAIGNLFIADANNHRIREVSSTTGTIVTVAGDGIQGNSGDGGPASAASIDTPSGLAVDSDGNLYLADLHNHRIRRIAASSGLIETVAGATPLPGSGGTAMLPRGLSLDAAGNLYVADTMGHRIVMVTPGGSVTAIAGEGTQGFAGDNGPAPAALLNRPRGIAVSPSGLLVLADTGNQRLRQIDQAGVIQTLGGVGSLVPGALSLTGPSVVQYGTGALTATASASATGAVTFLQLQNGVSSTIGTTTLASGAARLDTSLLPSGSYSIYATYSGNQTYTSTQSNVLLLTVSPAPVVASVNSATSTYGLPIPPLTGSVSGILPRDAGTVSAVFTTPADAQSQPGNYPILAFLAGGGAANYVLGSSPPGVLAILPAPTTTSLVGSLAGSNVGLRARVVSATTGVPTGTVAFLDAGSLLGSSAVDGTGTAAVSFALGTGTHELTARYGGDGNFLESTSASVPEVIAPAVAPDFILVAGNTAATIAAGGVATFSFTVSVQNGPLSGPILLTVSGVPAAATAGFNPAYLPPGGTAPAFVLSVQMAATTAQVDGSGGLKAEILWAVVWMLPLTMRRRMRLRESMRCLGLILLGAMMIGCGDRIAVLPSANTGATSYPITVTGTTTTSTGAVLQHTATVTLTVQ